MEFTGGYKCKAVQSVSSKHYILEDITLYSHRCKNLRSSILVDMFACIIQV
jgi:hypothetical protein